MLVNNLISSSQADDDNGGKDAFIFFCESDLLTRLDARNCLMDGLSVIEINYACMSLSIDVASSDVRLNNTQLTQKL